MGCGVRLCSDYFEVAGQVWRLEVYPAGFTADTRKYISIFLTTPGSIASNQILHEVAVVDQVSPNPKPYNHLNFTALDAGSCKF